jgi:hypothetical protein
MGTLGKRIREFFAEVRDRRAGRQAMGSSNDMFRKARGIVGITGNSFSNAWDYIDSGGDAYLKSMEKEPHLPPSLFISERDRTRLGQPMPLAERCIEDHGNEDRLDVGDWDITELEDERS